MDKETMEAMPARFGICMEGNETLFCEALNRVTLRVGNGVMEPLHYVEIGVALGETLRGVEGFVTRHPVRRDWRLTGVDIPGGWSLDLEAVRRNFGGRVWGPEEEFDPEAGTKGIVLTPAQVFLRERWPAGVPIAAAFVDGCHGEACARGDFLALEPLVAPGGMVIFHDANEGCQGHHHQPHCRTGIAVRAALLGLGLLDGSRPGWRLFGETTEVPHGIAVFERVGSGEF